MRTINDFNGNDFVHEVYLNATPSVDLRLVSADAPIDCCDYTIPISVYKRIEGEFDLLERGDEYDERRADLRAAANMWLLNCGPQLVRG